MLKESGKTTNKNADLYNKKLKTTKRDQLKLENSFAEIKSELKTTNSKLDKAEEWISALKGKTTEITQSEQQTER